MTLKSRPKGALFFLPRTIFKGDNNAIILMVFVKSCMFGDSSSHEKRVTKVVFYWDQPFQVGWVGCVVSCSIDKKPFTVGLVAQLFHPASNWVETVEKALVATAFVFSGCNSCYLRD